MSRRNEYQSTPAKLPHGEPKADIFKLDGWENCFTGYGTHRDKVKYTNFQPGAPLDWRTLSALYYSDDICAKLVEKRPEEAFRRGYELTGKDAEKLQNKAEALCVDGKVQESWKWGRTYGSVLLVPGLITKGKPTDALDVNLVRDVKFLNVVDSRYFRVALYYTDPLAANYGEPMVYRITSLEGGTYDIHESRVIRFDGTEVDPVKRRELGGNSYSVLQRPYDVIQQFATAFAGAAVLTADASQAVFKMKGLFEMIASGEKDRLQTRMALVDMSRSAARAVLLDSDGEEFERIATQFAGLPDMLDRFMIRLAASVDMPVTILMGRSPAGENATGDSDFQHWYDSISSQQTKYLEPKLRRLYQMLAGSDKVDIAFAWRSLNEPTDIQKADTRLKNSQADKNWSDMGAVYPQEIAIARWGKPDNEDGFVIDVAQREKSLEAEKDLELNPPMPVMLPGQGVLGSTGATGTGTPGGDPNTQQQSSEGFPPPAAA